MPASYVHLVSAIPVVRILARHEILGCRVYATSMTYFRRNPSVCPSASLVDCDHIVQQQSGNGHSSVC